ncbi:MAG: 3-phosphoserine/phosphohydroxythreonine transaminase [Acidobacteriota bacterium]
MSERVFNFCAGPAALPLPVLEEAQRDLLALPGVGMSVMEISHRSKWFDEILGEAEANLRELLGLGDDHAVAFVQGGGQMQFSMVPINFLAADASADYVVTGSWSRKAAPEAAKEGAARVVWTGEEHNYDRVPTDAELELDPEASYLYFTSNETIQGVQFEEPPAADVALVCDASSDFLSRPLDLSRYGVYYACAQKNAGPAGLSVVILRRDFLERRKTGLHSMLDYGKHVEAGSRLNTPPTFAIYLFLLITRWLKGPMGGLPAVEEFNREKAALLYDVIDASPDFFLGHALRDCRSTMNVTFRLPSDELDQRFLAEAEQNGLFQLKGHRSVGGIRASIYNAMPRDGVVALRDFMVDFRDRS